MVDAKELDKYFECVKQLTVEAGKLVDEGIKSSVNVEYKKGDWDLVTKYDRMVEKILLDGLKENFPNHKFIAEETSADEKKVPELTDDPTWIIDPIDGTVNFVHGFPHSSISIALAIGKQLQIGIIYNPSHKELYTAKRGQGAFMNGVPIKTSTVTNLRKALVTSEPSQLHLNQPNRDILMGRMEALLTESQGVRNVGSSALTLAYVARGIVDSYQCLGLSSWDIAAGIILIEEAGGYVCDSRGGPFDLSKSGLVTAATPELANEICKLIVETDLKTQRKRLKRS